MLLNSGSSPTREGNGLPSAHSERIDQNLPSAKGVNGATSRSSKSESSPQISLSIDYSRGRTSRMRGDMSDNQDCQPLQHAKYACLNRSISFTENHASERGRELGDHKQDSTSTICRHSGTSLQKFCSDHEREQFRQVLNVTRGAIRKKRAQVKMGQKLLVASQPGIQQFGVQNDSTVEESRESISSVLENNQGLSKISLSNAPRPRKLFQSTNALRISRDFS